MRKPITVSTIDQMLKKAWDCYKIQPDTIWMSWRMYRWMLHIIKRRPKMVKINRMVKVNRFKKVDVYARKARR